MLDTQYRMHPCIGEISSQIFYHGKVKHGVKAEDRLPPFLSKLKKDFREKSLDSSPYIVINLKHSQEEQGMGGSLKNEEEANIVLNVLDDLLASNDEESSRLHVKPGHIGIITPYLEQRRLIHDLISENERFKDIKLQGFALDEDIHMPDNDNLLEIHTVDGFQGREKEIIIMSTVRSDPCHGIGFLKDWRRLNVACTRARRQFILVCNVEILSRDRYWARFINWTKTHPEAIFVSAHRYMQNDNNDREEEKRVNDTSNDDDYASTFF
jgi:superfamily I DNA and/or RNA helicase